MKYSRSGYTAVPQTLFDKQSEMSLGAKWLFTVLCWLENKFVNEKSFDETFTRTDKQLCIDSKLSLSVVKRSKAELVRAGLITTSLKTLRKTSGKLTSIHYTEYTIVD